MNDLFKGVYSESHGDIPFLHQTLQLRLQAHLKMIAAKRCPFVRGILRYTVRLDLKCSFCLRVVGYRV